MSDLGGQYMLERLKHARGNMAEQRLVGWVEVVDYAIAELSSLRARVAELEEVRDKLTEFYAGSARDARRYRYLREVGALEAWRLMNKATFAQVESAIDAALPNTEIPK